MTFAESPAAAVKQRLRDDLKGAIQGRRTGEVRLLRSLIAALDNAEAVPISPAHQRYVVLDFGDRSAEVPRRALSSTDIQDLLAREQAERETAAEELDRLGRGEAARALREEASLVAQYRDG